jgi:hypothetical protein
VHPARGRRGEPRGLPDHHQVLRKDLEFEGIFRFVPDGLMAAIPAFSPDAPNFTDWKGIGANVLVLTRAQVTGGDLVVEAQVYSVDTGQSMLAKRYSGRADGPRTFAHQASDDIMTLTQYKGVARTKIAFVSDRDSGKARRSKELYIVDYDGFNPRRVTVNNSINILPAWNPDGRSLAYVSYRQGSPDVFVAHIFEGRSTNVTAGKGRAGLRPRLESRRQAHRLREQPVRQHGHLGGQRGWHRGPPHHEYRGVGDGALLEPHRAGDRLHLGSWRRAADLSDGQRGAERAPADDGRELERRPGLEPVAAVQRDRLHLAPRRAASRWPVVDLATRQVRQITQGRGSCEFPTWAPNGRHLAFSCNRAGPGRSRSPTAWAGRADPGHRARQ